MQVIENKDRVIATNSQTLIEVEAWQEKSDEIMSLLQGFAMTKEAHYESEMLASEKA